MNKMLVCLDCGNIFDEPKRWEETHGLEYGPYEHWSGCPDCGGAYVEAHRCDGCGEWIATETYVKMGNERYCEDCFEICDLADD